LRQDVGDHVTQADEIERLEDEAVGTSGPCLGFLGGRRLTGARSGGCYAGSAG